MCFHGFKIIMNEQKIIGIMGHIWVDECHMDPTVHDLEHEVHGNSTVTRFPSKLDDILILNYTADPSSPLDLSKSWHFQTNGIKGFLHVLDSRCSRR